MNKPLVGTLVVVALAACNDMSPTAPELTEPDPTASILGHLGDVLVTNGNDGGPGSFRAAVQRANVDASVESIGFLPRVQKVRLETGVTFTGSQPLTIDGAGAMIDASEVAGRAFEVTGGGALALLRLGVRGAGAEGVAIEVPPTATGTIEITLRRLEIVGNGGHGILINDQRDPSTIDDVQPDSAGSAATLAVTVTDSKFLRNGYTVSDRDGLRVNEGGTGDLRFTVARVLADDNAADGIEIDERGPGDVVLDMTATVVSRNGKFDPADLDDGFDIDEYDEGSIVGRVFLSTASNNYEEGFDFNENNAGDLRIDMTLVSALRNSEEGIDLEEDDDFGAAGDPFGGGGDLVAVMRGVTTVGNGDAADGALKIREKEDGNLDVTLSSILSTHNVGTGIFARESQAGSAVVRIEKAISTNNRAGILDPFSLGHGIELLESGGGDLTATVSASAVHDNAGNGVFGDETGAGAGTVTLRNVQSAANALGPVGGTATFLP
ncbi:MAG: hypothetical protein AB7T31_08655 [Gemmatimonadales bacterium]